MSEEDDIDEPYLPHIPLEQAFTDVIYAQKKAPQWVIDDLIPVGTTFLAGPPKVSHKSTISLMIAALCARTPSRCLPVWCKCILGGRTLLFSYEADAGEVRSILEDGLRLTLEEGGLFVASDPWSFQLDQPGAREEILEYLDAHRPRLVIMDPFRNMWSGDENDSGEIIKTLGPLQRWSKANEAAIIIVHHVNKPPTSQDGWSAGNMFQMRGSSAIPGLADGIIVIEPSKHEGQITLHTKFKRSQGWSRRIQLGAPGYGWPSEGYEMLPEAAGVVKDLWKGQRVRVLDAMTWVADASQELKRVSGEVKSHLAALLRNGQIEMEVEVQNIIFPELKR